jgi:hypothetical protein
MHVNAADPGSATEPFASICHATGSDRRDVADINSESECGPRSAGLAMEPYSPTGGVP